MMPEVTKTKVLIVDDHQLARQLIGDVMRELGLTEVIAVGDGAVARDVLNQSQAENITFDIVFLDINLPHLEGMDILTLFRINPAFKKTAFVMFTASSEQSSVLKAIKAGAAGYLIKPVTKQAIKKAFHDALAWIDKQQ
jgi:two-component system chemotaxis response regulator CheY